MLTGALKKFRAFLFYNYCQLLAPFNSAKIRLYKTLKSIGTIFASFTSNEAS